MNDRMFDHPICVVEYTKMFTIHAY